MTGPRSYFDHAATTPLRPEALEAMLPFLTDNFANPSGAHAESRQARIALDDARDRIGDLLGVGPGDVILTSGGTEADDLAIGGGWDALLADAPAGAAPTAVVCAAMEHHAVLRSCRALASRTGAELRLVPTTPDGIVDLDALMAACDGRVGLVSVMAVNNEIGTVQPLDAVAAVVSERSPGAVLHTDAVQAAPWLDVAAATAPAGLVSVSAHKFGGPKGSGALALRRGARVRPRIEGGGQERGRRSGTQNVAGAVGMAAALSATVSGRAADVVRVTALRDRLGDGLAARLDGSVETGRRDDRVAGILHLRIEGTEAEALVLLLDRAGIAVSAGAACSSGAVEPSHVLQSMGLGTGESSSGIRFSLGVTTTEAEVDRALDCVPGVVEGLRN
ncbi:MAG: cysteine desulfurase family protein [Acidimicrobiales bacterium]|jgi:cysteine desulfurase